MYKDLFSSANLLFSSSKVLLLALPRYGYQESYGSAFSGSGSLFENTTSTTHGLAALSKISTTVVMIQSAESLVDAASLRSVGRLCIKPFPGTAPHILIHILLSMIVQKAHYGPL